MCVCVGCALIEHSIAERAYICALMYYMLRWLWSCATFAAFAVSAHDAQREVECILHTTHTRRLYSQACILIIYVYVHAFMSMSIVRIGF